MNKILSILVAVFVLSACASSGSSTDNSQASNEKRDMTGLKCQHTASTGTRLGRQVCTTKAEREAMAAEARDDVERMQKAGARGATKSN
ncbi:MAG: lipoprotein [Pseudomonadota bacterium]